MRDWLRVVALLTVLLLQSCATAPADRYDAVAARLALRRETVLGRGFTHVVYSNGVAASGGLLHVYLESDGTPWVHGQVVAADPTPQNPLTLRLMARDPAAAVLVGRPCYHGLSTQPGCNDTLWTFARYSEAVVASMAAAIEQVAAGRGIHDIVLIGYSGGGSLAMLLARRVAGVKEVVTVAANLDTDVWASMHGYRPLVDSLNPAMQPPLPRHIAQLHIAGGEDRNVPPQIIADFVARQPGAKLRVFQGADHACCWEQQWLQILGKL